MKGDNDNDKKNNPEFNTQAYKHAISMIESSGGKFLDNPNSSAAGRYHFLYELIKKDPDMKGISKRDFMNNTDLQERIMDKALAGKLSGYTYGINYAKKLKDEFNSDHDVSDLTALIHFLGPGNTRKYLKDPNSFVVPGKVNATAQEYVDKFRKHFDEYKSENTKEGKVTKDITNGNINNERAQAQVQKDATNVAKPRIPKQIQPVPQVNLKENLLQSLPASDGLDFIDNEFKDGGQMTGLSGANQLVTLFENGGSHEQNPIGGIPQGVGANGKLNLVEEGETKWNDYIFSNSFSLDGTHTGSDGVSTNVFENGGDLNNPTDPKKKESNTATDPKKSGPVKKSSAELKAIMDAQVKRNEANETPLSVKQGMYIDENSKTARVLREKEKYYNPEVKDATSGDWKQDLLYKNQWAMDLPFIGDAIKDEAKNIAKHSAGRSVLDVSKDVVEDEYRGSSLNQDENTKDVSMVDQYFSKEPLLAPSSYKPSSDYLEFLPSYSLKGEAFNDPKKAEDNQYYVESAIYDIIGDNYDSFVKDKNPVYKNYDQMSPLTEMLNTDLGGHKTGAAWDKDLDLPYISVSDAWDFSPEHYSQKYKAMDITDKEGKEEDKAYVQASLMHKAGNPYKVYDRIYFDPNTKKMISDEEVSKRKVANKVKNYRIE